MHVVLGLVLTILIKLILLKLLAKAGISLGGLNPFMWQATDKSEINTVQRIDNPLEATALLVTVAASLDSHAGSERRAQTLNILMDEIGLGKTEAERLIDTSAHSLSRFNDVGEEVDAILDTCLPGFTQAQAESALRMIEQASFLCSEHGQANHAIVENAAARIRQRSHDSP